MQHESVAITAQERLGVAKLFDRGSLGVERRRIGGLSKGRDVVEKPFRVTQHNCTGKFAAGDEVFESIDVRAFAVTIEPATHGFGERGRGRVRLSSHGCSLAENPRGQVRVEISSTTDSKVLGLPNRWP